MALDASGATLGTKSGFFQAPDLVFTTFEAINAASKVRLAGAGEGPRETCDVVSWNRRDDWAILRFAQARSTLAATSPELPRVGDRLFFFDAQADGSRAIVETSVVGRTPSGDLSLGDIAEETSQGGPVFNEFGEIVASLAGSGTPGARRSSSPAWATGRSA